MVRGRVLRTSLTDNSGRVLHVNPPTYGETMGLSGAIGDAGLRESLCPDVYRALARMGGASGPAFRAVLVCVDRMGADQFSFFELLSRHFASSPVFVYARSNAEEKIERAVGLGCIRIGDSELLTSALSIHSAPDGPSSDHPAPADTERELEDPIIEVVDSQLLTNGPTDEGFSEDVDHFEAIETVDEELEPAADEEDGVVRVPWLQYEDSPRRIPPSRSRLDQVDPPPHESLLSDEPPRRTPEPTPPLLSTEELQALIGKPDDAIDHGLDEPGVRGS